MISEASQPGARSVNEGGRGRSTNHKAADRSHGHLQLRVLVLPLLLLQVRLGIVCIQLWGGCQGNRSVKSVVPPQTCSHSFAVKSRNQTDLDEVTLTVLPINHVSALQDEPELNRLTWELFSAAQAHDTLNSLSRQISC